MAAKRLQDDDRRELSEFKRVRQLPSFSTVIREATMAKSLHSVVYALEPLLRKAVREEVERGVIHSASLFQRSISPVQIEAAPETPNLKLKFKNPLTLPIFTNSKIEEADGNPLQLILVDADDNELPFSSLPSSSPVRVQLVVLDGDFPSGDRGDWTTAEFERKIVKERTGKRPLLAGDVNGVALRDGRASISDLSFTDNSSWIRSRHFRIGARATTTPKGFDGLKIKEAMTEPFKVKDHRGELYKKHYPPALGDDVWRLERIGKDGVFHKKLSAEGIKTVQDFLKLLTVDPHHLRRVLGVGMSDRMWEGTVAHAKTCILGDKLYVHRCGPQLTLLLNSICQVVWIVSDTSTNELQYLTEPQKAYVQDLAREAYQNWDKLEDTEDILLLPQNVRMHQREMVDSLFWDPDQENEVDHLSYGLFQPFYQ